MSSILKEYHIHMMLFTRLQRSCNIAIRRPTWLTSVQHPPLNESRCVLLCNRPRTLICPTKPYYKPALHCTYPNRYMQAVSLSMCAIRTLWNIQTTLIFTCRLRYPYQHHAVLAGVYKLCCHSRGLRRLQWRWGMERVPINNTSEVWKWHLVVFF